MPVFQHNKFFRRLKNTIYLENARLITNTDEAEPADYLVYKPIAGDIMLLYMVDTDESMHTLNHEHMKEAGIEDETPCIVPPWIICANG